MRPHVLAYFCISYRCVRQRRQAQSEKNITNHCCSGYPRTKSRHVRKASLLTSADVTLLLSSAGPRNIHTVLLCQASAGRPNYVKRPHCALSLKAYLSLVRAAEPVDGGVVLRLSPLRPRCGLRQPFPGVDPGAESFEQLKMRRRQQRMQVLKKEGKRTYKSTKQHQNDKKKVTRCF